MKSHTDVAIIGAGPYGLSIAAHLRAASVDHRVFGMPMEAWSRYMPRGMYLKSDAQASSLSDPSATFTLETYCASKKIDYHDYRIPVRLEDFIDYGLEFQKRFVPTVEERRVLLLRADNNAFALEFDRGDAVKAKRVVLATGVVPFKHLPSAIARLPEALGSHSADSGSLERFKNKEVAVIGAGSSAIDMAALLAAQGAEVTLIARARELKFQPMPSVSRKSVLKKIGRRLLSPPSHGLGNGWLMRICAEAPHVIHTLPDWLRVLIVTRTLGPSGGYFVRKQIESGVRVMMGSAIVEAKEKGGRVLLSLTSQNSAPGSICVDHVIAATGYKVDLRRLNFLDALVLRNIKMAGHSPVLSRSFESSVPGLYFAGLTAARSFGPALRFVMGAVHPARIIAYDLPRSLAHDGRSRLVRVER